MSVHSHIAIYAWKPASQPLDLEAMIHTNQQSKIDCKQDGEH